MCSETQHRCQLKGLVQINTQKHTCFFFTSSSSCWDSPLIFSSSIRPGGTWSLRSSATGSGSETGEQVQRSSRWPEGSGDTEITGDRLNESWVFEELFSELFLSQSSERHINTCPPATTAGGNHCAPHQTQRDLTSILLSVLTRANTTDRPFIQWAQGAGLNLILGLVLTRAGTRLKKCKLIN